MKALRPPNPRPAASVRCTSQGAHPSPTWPACRRRRSVVPFFPRRGSACCSRRKLQPQSPVRQSVVGAGLASARRQLQSRSTRSPIRCRGAACCAPSRLTPCVLPPQTPPSPSTAVGSVLRLHPAQTSITPLPPATHLPCFPQNTRNPPNQNPYSDVYASCPNHANPNPTPSKAPSTSSSSKSSPAAQTSTATPSSPPSTKSRKTSSE
jgi:hypothetical protein